MEAFGYLLNINEAISAYQARKKKEVERIVESKQRKRLELFLTPENEVCFLCNHPILKDSKS